MEAHPAWLSALPLTLLLGSHLLELADVTASEPRKREGEREDYLSAFRQRLIQGAIATGASGIMLAAFFGLSAAAPPAGAGHGNGHSDQGHGNQEADASQGNSGGASQGNSGGGSQPATAQGNAGGAPGDRGRSVGLERREAAGTLTDSNERPGWGCGDPNHVHTGPAGGGGGFDPCTFRVVTRTLTSVSGTETQTLTVTETETQTATTSSTETTTATTTSGT